MPKAPLDQDGGGVQIAEPTMTKAQVDAQVAAASARAAAETAANALVVAKENSAPATVVKQLTETVASTAKTLVTANTQALAIATTPEQVKMIIPNATPAVIQKAIAAATPADVVKAGIPVAGVLTTMAKNPILSAAVSQPKPKTPSAAKVKADAALKAKAESTALASRTPPKSTTAPTTIGGANSVAAGVTVTPPKPAVATTTTDPTGGIVAGATVTTPAPIAEPPKEEAPAPKDTTTNKVGAVVEGLDAPVTKVRTQSEIEADNLIAQYTAEYESMLAANTTAENAVEGIVDPTRVLSTAQQTEILDPANTGSPAADTNWDPADVPTWDSNTGWQAPGGGQGSSLGRTPETGGPTGSSTTSDGTLESLEAMLRPYGMEGVMTQIRAIREKFPQIKTDDILTLIKFDPAYNAPYLKRFAGNAELIKQGKQPLEMSDYLKNEAAYEKVFKAYGTPTLASRESYAKLIGGSVSPDEAGERVNLAYTRILGDSATLDAFKKYYPQLSTGDLIAMSVDPVNQLPELQKKVTAAEIGGAAAANAFALSQEQANELGQAYGIDKAGARKGFSDIFQMRQLGQDLPGDISGSVSQDEMLGVKFRNDAKATEKIKKVAETRLAEYEAGGAMVETSKGVSGLGSATRGT